MIKYESIISSFDDKDTLYNWLRKVEEQLKNASATGFVVNKKGNATLSFSITFANGETLESGDIVLQQGESVDGARIASGVLQLHLTNGTWLTAGNLGAVSSFSIDANQHLIVNYQDGTSQDLGAIFNGSISINGNITATGDISANGKIQTNDEMLVSTDITAGGKITANEIVENMTGYSGGFGAKEGLTLTGTYLSVCKNGNKITFVAVGEITKTGDVLYNFATLAGFTIPLSIANKLVPVNNTWLSFIKSYFASDYESGVEIPVVFNKSSSSSVEFNAYALQNLTLNTKYYFRLEQTFLLSDNLAQ